MVSVDARALRIGRQQQGLATRAQLRTAGVSDTTVRRRLADGRWAEPLPGVIDLGAHPPSWHGRLRGLLLAAGPRACASHATAAYLHGFLDVRRPSRLDVLVPRVRHAQVGGIRLRTTVALRGDELTDVQGFACTCAARTLVDVAATAPASVLERLTLDLGRRSPNELARVPLLLDRRPGAPGRARLRRLLATVPSDVAQLESPLEVLGLARLRSVGLAPPVLQHVVVDEHGRRLRRVDAAWPAKQVAVEFDGSPYHDTPSQREFDDLVRRRMSDLGWNVVVVRAGDLRQPAFEAVVQRLRAALQ